MKFTTKTITTTKNNSLKTILTNMKPQIAKGIELVVAQEEASTGRSVSEFSRECIELELIFDICKSVVSYTKNSDRVKSFTSGVSIKGNYEMSGIIVRDGQEHSFYCEAIIADGMVNRRHVRYITKTSLPKESMEEANKIKTIIKKNNKIISIQSYIDTLVSYKEDAQKKYDKGIAVTREEWKAFLISEDKWLLGDNWGELVEENLHTERGWDTEEQYLAWVDEANETSIEWEIDFIKDQLQRVSQLEKSIAKEMIKLEKAKQS